MANALSYYGTKINTVVKGFTVQAPESDDATLNEVILHNLEISSDGNCSNNYELVDLRKSDPGRHGTQHNDTQHNDIQHNYTLHCDTQHNKK